MKVYPSVVAMTCAMALTAIAGGQGNYALVPSITNPTLQPENRPKIQYENWPESVLVLSDGTATIRYERVPYDSRYSQLAQGSILGETPVFSLDDNGKERRGIWFETSEEFPCGKLLPYPDELLLENQYRKPSEGGRTWTAKMGFCEYSHPPCGPGISFMLPHSDAIWIRMKGMELPAMASGFSRGGQLITIFTDNGDSPMPAAALPAMAKVEALFNRLLSSPTNLNGGNARVNVQLRYLDIPDNAQKDPPGGVLPFLNPIARTLNDFDVSSLNQLRTTHLGPRHLEEDAAGLVDGHEQFLLDINFPTASDIWTRVGPGVFPAPPATFTGSLERIGDGIGEILIPNGLQAFFDNRAQLIIVEFDSTVAWDWDSSDGIGLLESDFEGTLIHEMGHVLGFVSRADATSNFDAMPILDLFRFDGIDMTHMGTGSRFLGIDSRFPRVLVASSAPATGLGRQSNHFFPMSRGDNEAPDNTNNIIPPGDARQASHWRDDAYGGAYIGVMDPDGFSGGAAGNNPLLPFYLSQVDIRAIDMIGWHIESNRTPTQLLGLANPTPGSLPIAGAVDVVIPPVFEWAAQDPNPSDLPGVTFVLFGDALGPNNPSGADVLYRVDGLTKSTLTLPAGIVQPGTTYSWTTVTHSPWSFSQSGPYTFTTEFVCLADVNMDGVLTPADFTAWINAFNNNLPECDQNGDGLCTPADFTAWTANFNAGCP